jgi:hypothetical protein
MLAAAIAAASLAAADDLPGTAHATAFLRVRGDVSVERVETWRQVREHSNVEVALGSGFFVTPTGYLVTNRHVIDGGAMSRRAQGGEVRVSVTGVDVFLDGPEALPAVLVAVDEEHDLALLAVSAGEPLPYVAMGDSDALDPGQRVTAWGFPMGRRVEVGRAASDALVPSVSSSPGHLSAVRRDDEEQARYLQTDAALNPGNSGGPLVDEEGYAVGVVRMKLAEGQALGFGIPINLVKDFLERNGLAAELPRRYRLGPGDSMGWKGLSLQAAEGIADTWPGRTRWDSPDEPGGLRLRVDRVLSPMALQELADALLAGQVLDGLPAVRREPGSRPDRTGGRSALLGSGRGTHQDLAVEFAVLGLGAEKLVARYTGPEAVVAYNRAVLRASLASLSAYGKTPLREEIVRPVGGSPSEPFAIVTRNRYGALVLNAARVPFVDVDTPKAPALGGLRRLFGGGKADPAAETLERVRATCVRFPRTSFRIYRTAAGLRLMATDLLLDPASAQAREMLEAFGADESFTKLCRLQSSFRARLSPKPWRCGCTLPPGRHPREPAEQLAHTRWLQEYEAATRGKAVCALVESVGPGRVLPEVQPVVEEHDRSCRVGQPLTLA